jgi:hypothetical protein
MSKHTPGPWRYVPGGGHATNRIVGAGDIQKYGWPEPINGVSNASYSDTVCSDVGDIDLPGPAANAKLIAAAPEMLDALKEVKHWLEGWASAEAELDFVNRIIAKATA